MKAFFGHRPVLAWSTLAMAITLAPLAAQQASEKTDYTAIEKIKEQGFAGSQVMEITSWLTDVHGPRLTNSPGFRKAGDWAVTQLKEWGLSNVALEPWGPFGRGWSNEHFRVEALTPTPFTVIGYPKAWSAGTNGPVTGEAILVDIQNDGDYAKYQGKLRGRIALVTPLREVPAMFEAPAHRYTRDELAGLESESDATPRGRFGGPGRAGGPGGGRGALQAAMAKRAEFFKTEGVLAIVDASRGDGDAVFVQAAQGVSRDIGTDAGVPQLTFSVEHYGRLARALEKNVPVTLSLDVKNTFHDEAPNPQSFNVIAEIPGTDKANEVVMLGGHFDSWHSATGATDNAAGVAVMMEAMRILKQSGLPLRRTVRLALWGGEEQGLLGSRAYVAQHFADRTDMVLKRDHSTFAGYFNVDNGTGAIRGIYTQGNEAVVPIFQQWMTPFANLGMTTVTIRDTGGTDHLAFDAVGLPGFQFIQDPVEYETRTHHSNMDTYERIQEEDMRKNAVIVATFVFNTANRDEKLPRKPLPAAQPPAGRGTTAGQ